MGKTFVMGDIHGNYRALLQCLERSGFDKQEDTLIQLGDVADGWSETAECVEELLSIKNLISIRGNHDIWCHDWFKHGMSPILWTQQGGKATMDSYVRTGLLVDQHHKDFWNDQVDWYIDDENRLFIHAGWDYMYRPLELTVGDLSNRTLFEMQANLKVNAGTIARECHWDRSLIMGARSAFGRNNDKNGKFKALEQFHEIYIGHTADNEGPKQYGNLWNMDSGAGWNGRLSLMDIDTKEIWQSDYATLLYPEERGRM